MNFKNLAILQYAVFIACHESHPEPIIGVSDRLSELLKI
jgi:hypothetical protein